MVGWFIALCTKYHKRGTLKQGRAGPTHDCLQHLCESVPQGVPAVLVHQHGESIVAWSSINFGGPNTFFHIIFTWNFLQFDVIFFGKYRFNLLLCRALELI